MRVVSGSARGTILKTPEGLSTRPTTDRVKEAMFSILQFSLPGAAILDLFGGTGQLGIEGLSRGASHVVFIDESSKACDLIKENLKRTRFTAKAEVIRSDYLSYLQSCKVKFDIVLLDPPYAEVFLENALKIISEIDILQSGGIIVAEWPLGKDMNLTFCGLERVKDYKYGNTLLTIYRKVEHTEGKL